jgi:hypothetical protein
MGPITEEVKAPGADAKVLLMPEVQVECWEEQEITVNFATESHLGVVDSLLTVQGGLVHVKGPFDTGSKLSFLW